MASVVDITPPARASLTPSYRKIRLASRGFAWLFTGLVAAFGLLVLFSWWVLFFYQGTLIAVGPSGGLLTTEPLPAGFRAFRDWALAEKLVYAAVVPVRAAPSLALFFCLRALFRLYGQGQVFGARNAALIKAMGVALIADALAPGACHVVLSATGYEIDQLWFHPIAGLQELVLGAVVFVIALVMQAGREIEEDREGFI